MQDNWKDQVNKCLTLYVQYLLICINKHEHSYSQMIINTCMRFIIFLSFEQQIMSLMTNSNESIMIFYISAFKSNIAHIFEKEVISSSNFCYGLSIFCEQHIFLVFVLI